MTGRPTKYSPELGEKLYKFMKDGKSISAAAEHLNVHRDTLYEWAKVHSEFKKYFDRGIQASCVWHENAMEEMARNKDTKNPQVNASIFLMTNRFRTQYGKNAGNEATINIKQDLTTDELDRRLEALMHKDGNLEKTENSSEPLDDPIH
jgi:transposase-like protein